MTTRSFARSALTLWGMPTVRYGAQRIRGTGRILTIVNQQMAFSSGFEPCSTIKPFVALAGAGRRRHHARHHAAVGRRRYMDLTEAMAHSNNVFFQEVGTQLGFDRVSQYATAFGVGFELGYNIHEEQPGSLPRRTPALRRRSPYVELRRRHSHHAVAACVAGFHSREWRYAVLPAVSAHRMAIRSEFSSRASDNSLDIAPLLPDLREGMLSAGCTAQQNAAFDPARRAGSGKNRHS